MPTEKTFIGGRGDPIVTPPASNTPGLPSLAGPLGSAAGGKSQWSLAGLSQLETKEGLEEMREYAPGWTRPGHPFLGLGSLESRPSGHEHCSPDWGAPVWY